MRLIYSQLSIQQLLRVLEIQPVVAGCRKEADGWNELCVALEQAGDKWVRMAGTPLDE